MSVNPTDWINRRTAGASRRSRERRLRMFADAISAAGLRGATVLDATHRAAVSPYLLRILPTVALTLSAFFLLRRLAPRLLSFATGGRS